MNLNSVFFGVLAILAVAVAPVYGETSDILPEPIRGVIVHDNIEMGKSVSGYCYLESSRHLSLEGAFIVTGINTCEKFGEKKIFYEVVYRGKRYYVPESSLKIDDADLVRLQVMPEDVADTVRKVAISGSGYAWLSEVEKAMKKLKNMAKHGITLYKAAPYEISEYTDGTGFEFTVYNPTKKRIKYITLTYVGYNAVKDPVKDYTSKSGAKTFKGIGPIEPGEKVTYSKDYAWMTDIVETVKVTNIRIDYMDGTKKIVQNPKLVTLDRDTRNVLDDFGGDDSFEAAQAALE